MIRQSPSYTLSVGDLLSLVVLAALCFFLISLWEMYQGHVAGSVRRARVRDSAALVVPSPDRSSSVRL